MADDLSARYAAAERLLGHATRGLVTGGAPYVAFTGDGDRFVFPSSTGPLLVDPAARTAVPMQETSAPATAGEGVSPDGRWQLLLRDGNLALRDLASGDERRLTDDADDDVGYAQPPDASSLVVRLQPLGRRFPLLARWSADSRHVVTQRVDQTGVGRVAVVEASPPDGGRPRSVSWRYAFTGDEALPLWELVVVDVEGGVARRVPDLGPVPVPFTTALMGRTHNWWSTDGRLLYVLTSDRRSTTLRLHAVDVAAGEARLVVEESAETPLVPGAAFTPCVRTLSTGEVLWWSERTGWGHLYLYAADGSGARQLTDGDWVARDVVAVDEQRRTAVITGSGREPGLDPYVRQLYRLELDTGELTRLTDDRLDHEAVGSPSGCFVVDAASDVSTPSVVMLRDHSGEVQLELGCADASDLLALGYEPPERFSVKAADGETDLYGVLYRPHGLDPSQRYPVLEDSYFNARSAMASVRYPGSGGLTELQPLASSFAALGFAVVVLDSRGTALRSRAFREHSLGLGFDDGLKDRAEALRQLAATRPWLDVERAGVYGMSAGGYAAARAILRHPDVYRAAVAGSGSHDDRLALPNWAEQVHGPFGTTDWESLSNSSLAGELRGRLLLVQGDVDDVVLPSVTLRLVDAFMTADRDVDLLYVPGGDHGVLVNDPAVVRRVWDYLVRHVALQDPPPYRLKPFPPDTSLDQLLAMFS